MYLLLRDAVPVQRTVMGGGGGARQGGGGLMRARWVILVGVGVCLIPVGGKRPRLGAVWNLGAFYITN